MNLIKKIRWWLFALLAIGVGLYPSLYLFIKRTFGLLGSKSPELLESTLWNTMFYAHIFLGGLALLIGWIQFSESIRSRSINFHRIIGKIYVISAVISGIASLYIGYYATGGLVASLGFICLGVVWLYTTIGAYVAIKNQHLKRHQELMIYSYAACFAAVTLRIWLPLLTTLFDGAFLPAYKIVAWLCWVPNIIVAYFIVRKTAGPTPAL